MERDNQDLILLVMGPGSNDSASMSPGEYKASEEAAFNYAIKNEKKIIALQVLYSKLYHWGHTDPIVPGYGRTQFIMYLREKVLNRGMKLKSRLEAKAKTCGVPIEIISVESENPNAIILEEAGKGYEAIFIPQEKKTLFPLFRKTLCQILKRQSFKNVVVC